MCRPDLFDGLRIRMISCIVKPQKTNLHFLVRSRVNFVPPRMSLGQRACAGGDVGHAEVAAHGTMARR